MNSRTQSLQAWRSVRRQISPGERVTIPKGLQFPHPRDAGARPTVSWPVGQLADYALEFELGGAPLLVQEFTDRFEVVLAGVELTGRLLALIQANPEAAAGVGGALIGAALGATLTRKSEGTMLGASIGALAALMVNACHQKRASAPRN